MIANKVHSIDAVLYTHSCMQTMCTEFDDLRGFALTQRRRIPIHADPEYHGPHSRRLRLLPRNTGWQRVPADYPAGADQLAQRADQHCRRRRNDQKSSRSTRCMARSGRSGSASAVIAYCCDVSDFPRATVEKLQDLDVLIIDIAAAQAAPEHIFPSTRRYGGSAELG